ncbi:hypothetical protein [Methanoculleus sp. 7T]|jgi:hypothetical protein|uniref:hypothetical protein n=1 Tax=Methanoculleus sp. 7T TaxID=2937282 RepID=UPI0020BF9B4A|nr:hypothetical protein [Methanoculleus sp. 7T]MCK8519465.1 hypothetical protein [Methanoculleus sp. 7T]
MSKHHANALIVLGIAICAGFLLPTPAVAGPGHGIATLESGELLSFPFGDRPAAENGSELSNTSALSEDEDPDAFPTSADAGAPVQSSDAEEEPVMPADQNSSGGPVSPVLPDDEPLGLTDRYDDERLAGLINTASIRLMKLSMEHAHALYLQDTDAASIAADDLHALSTRLLGEVQPLEVSPEQQPVKDEFIRLLEAYSAASEELLGTSDAGTESVPAAFKELAAASEGLEAVNQQTGEMRIDRTSTPAATLAAAAAPVVQAETAPVLVAPPPEMLPLRERYSYDDPSGENMVSLLVESTRTATTYQQTSANTSAVKVEAGEGRMFLLVVAKATNLGHKGDSDLYTIETPERSAFVLEYQGSTFAPLEVPSFTSLGESFDRKALERYESLKGYLYFDVPASLNASEATLKADLGEAGTPAWNLGKELGEEAGKPDAV